MNNKPTEIYLTISYKVTDDAKGIEESENFSQPFSKFPTYDEVLEAFCTGTDWALEENRSTLSVSFWASVENNKTLDCDIEW